MASERSRRRIEHLLDEADDAVSRLDWESARNHAQAVLAFEPDNGDAIELITAADRALRLPSEAASTGQDQTGQEPHTSATGAEIHRAPTDAQEAERRQLTVMFCDLQGSTALSQQLDPEVLRDVIRGYQEVCAGAVGRFEGHIAKYLGDGLLVYFGYPQAHEDDPQRAVRAGLAILEDMTELNAQLKSEKDLELTVRIGIHTGLVVAGEMGGGDTLEELAIVGETPNIAARIEGAALPNSVVVSNVSANLVQGFFLYESLGPHELKGISEPVELFRVLEESGAQSRFDVAVSSQLTPLVGREQEVGLLLNRWEQAEEGLGQVVLISGEAGIGKSRLLQGIYDGLEGQSHWLLVHRCSPYHQNSPLFPIIESLERWLGFRTEDSPEDRLNILEGRLRDYSVQLTESIPVFAGLLSVPLDDRYPDLNFSPQRQRQRSMELLVQLLVETAGEKPVLAVYEDLHWADPTTLEFLGLLVDQAATSKVMAMFTFRPEFSPPWGSRSHLSQITLNRLPQRLATEMIARITGGKELPEEVVSQIAAKSDGVPLFVEELTQMVLESGLLLEVDGRYELTGPLTDLAIPSTLQDSLTARLDRLGEVKEVVQLASVLGREFIYQLIQAVSQRDDSPLSDHLRQLVSGEFLYQQGVIPEARYIFKHALMQDAAYNSLLISRRQQYHQLVAQVYEESFPETVESQPELVAHHYTEAGNNQQAVAYWQKAGQIATRRSANVEAVNHFTKGLELLETLPDTRERDSQEVALQTMLGQCLIQIKGFGSAEVQQAFSRASVLIEQVEGTSLHFQALNGLRSYYLVRGEYQKSRTVAEKSLEAAQINQDPIIVQMAREALGTTMMYMGDLLLAEEQFNQEVVRYDLERERSLASLYGLAPSCMHNMWLGHIKWLLGYPDQSSNHIQEALGIAKEVAHPFTHAFVLTTSCMFFIRSQAIKEVNNCLAAVIPLADEQKFRYLSVQASLFRGWVWTKSGKVPEGIDAIIGSMDYLTRIGSEISKAYNLSNLAEAQGEAGETDQGLETLQPALAHVEESEERLAEADIHRVKGDLLLLSGESDGRAEECFQHSIDIARRQSAKSWELRTSISLARLWRKRGKVTEARELLAGIYGWFTEGFDTPDLIEVKGLLEELS